MVLCMDIEDFFGSIGYGRVYHMFREFGYNKSVATLLANLCTVNGALPQGTPTSPAISNIICRAMDEQIAKYAKAEEINYTRYADDLTFSGDFDAVSMIREVRQILGAYGFRVNEKKTRVLKHSQQQKVVGVVVNKKMQVPRKERDRFRQEAYYIQKFGMKGRFGGHLRKKKSKLSAEKYLSILIGQVAGALFINPEDEKLKQYREIFRRAAAELRPPF
jgi:RNA-directed DNA polymerase